MRRDLRRHPLGVGLRPARRRAQGEHQAAVVAVDGHRPRRHRRPRLSVILPAPDLGGLAATSATFTDPLAECQSLPQALPRRPPAGGVRRSKKGIDDPDSVDLADVACPNCGTRGAVDRAARVQHDAQDLPRRRSRTSRPALPAPRDRAGHLPQLRQRHDQPRARSRRSASPRSARASATRSRPATSSSAPASSSRWRWSSSSSPARTRSGTSTGSTSAPAGTSTSASTPTTCATTSTRRRSSRHYSKRTVDIEYRFGFTGREWGELEGIANRTDFDLTDALASTPGRTCPTSTRPAASATRRTSSSRRPA